MKAIVVGAGINGVTAAIELKKRGHDVKLVDPGPLPHPLAASTDISKAVRAAYGADEDYTALAQRAIARWRDWNEEITPGLYHEIGMMFLRKNPMQPGDFEYERFQVLERLGQPVQRMDLLKLRERAPAWQGDEYDDGILERAAGFVESARVVAALIDHAKLNGVELLSDRRFSRLHQNDSCVNGVMLDSGELIGAEAVVMAVGAWTPYLLPFTSNFF